MSYNTHPFCVSLVTMAEYVQVYPEERISTVAKTITEESGKEVVVQETVVHKEDKKLPKQIIPEQKISQPIRQRDDDWFLLLDLVPRETAYVPPGTHSLQMSFFFFTHITQKKTILQVN